MKVGLLEYGIANPPRLINAFGWTMLAVYLMISTLNILSVPYGNLVVPVLNMCDLENIRDNGLRIHALLTFHTVRENVMATNLLNKQNVLRPRSQLLPIGLIINIGILFVEKKIQ